MHRCVTEPLTQHHFRESSKMSILGQLFDVSTPVLPPTSSSGDWLQCCAFEEALLKGRN